MRNSDNPMANEKLLTVLRGLSPEGLRAVIKELTTLGPSVEGTANDNKDVVRRPPSRARPRR